jgi:hypothetical protein
MSPPSDGLVECTFLIPLVGNSDRRQHSPTAWRDFAEDLLELYGAFSGPEIYFRTVSLVAGEWEGIKDKSRRYTVALPRNRIPVLRGFLEEQCCRFDQEAIYLSVAGEVEFIRPRGDD